MARVLSLWLKEWPLDRWRRQKARLSRCDLPALENAFATLSETGGRRLLAAVNRKAVQAGLSPGMPLADARALLPGLKTAASEPAEDQKALRQLAEWCVRYSPWIAPEETDGVRIEIAGSAHLWGGEEALAADLSRRLGREKIAHRIAVADTIGGAFAVARFAAGDSPLILASSETRSALAPLPVEALRLDPATAEGLRSVGLKRIGDLYAMPRAALTRRFGTLVARQLDRALGDLPEPFSPLGETPLRRVRLGFAEPVAVPEDLKRAIRRQVSDLCGRLEREGMGARRLDLSFHRLDGRVERIALGTAQPSRDPHHLSHLLAARLEDVDPGPGIEDMILSAFAVEPLAAEQFAFSGPSASALAPLLDRLGNRLGLAALYRLETRTSYIPEKASMRIPLASGAPPRELQEGKPPRPIRLLLPPEPIEAAFLLPDDPPFHFIWRRRRHRVQRADGPERIAHEWWQGEGAIRDYYRVEDEEGRRFWLYRAGLPSSGGRPRWFLHGIFA
jgi:protein ImuB